MNTVEFQDGPAIGVTLNLERQPLFLRVVRDIETGAIDALDQLDDEPKATEEVFVYRRTYHSSGIACSRGKNGGCRRFSLSHYSLFVEQPEQAVMRDTEKWRGWTDEAYAIETANDDARTP